MARSTALVGLGAALLVALVAGGAGWVLTERSEDRRLGDALRTFAHELEQESDGSEASVRSLTAEEQREVLHTGVRLAVYREGRPLAGALRGPAGPGCVSHAGLAVRRCALSRGRDVLYAEASQEALRGWQRSMALALGLALGLVGLLSVWSSRRVASLAIEPLERLRGAVASLDPEAPDASKLGDPSDCAEVEQLRQEFGRLLASLAASLGHARRFASNAAHEWRTPLSTLRAELELLEEELARSGSAQALQRMGAQVRELQERLDRVLVLANPARLARGEAVSLDSTAREAAAGEPRVRVLTEEEGLVRGDAALLRMLLRNVLDNALKYSAGAVRVAVRAEQGLVRVEVEDEGPGVPAAERERVFEAFYRGKSAAGARGSGLGLALVAHIARMHGGSARFLDAEKGARLLLEVPAWSA